MKMIYLKKLLVTAGIVVVGMVAAQKKQTITKAQLPSNAQDFLINISVVSHLFILKMQKTLMM